MSKKNGKCASQGGQAWLSPTDAASGSLAGLLVLTLILLMTVGMLVHVLHGERPREFPQPGVYSLGFITSEQRNE